MTLTPPERAPRDLPIRVLYIGGVGRSGSTVLGRSLSAVPGVVSVGEVVHLWSRGVLGDESCGCGAPFSQCPFWGKVGDQAFGGWDLVDGHAVERLRLRVDRTRFLPWLMLGRGPGDFESALAEYGGVLERLYRAIQDVSGAQVVIDTSKHASFANVLHLTPGVDLRVVHLVRDARGVAYSWSKKVERPEVRGEVEYMQGDSPATLARYWMFTNACFDAAAARGMRMLRVRYEDFVAHPRESVAQLLEFAGLADTAGIGEALATSEITIPVQHEVSGNPMRFGGERLRLRADDAWGRELSARDRAVVSAVAAPMMRRYRY
jgi:Sulfotransferase domain